MPQVANYSVSLTISLFLLKSMYEVFLTHILLTYRNLSYRKGLWNIILLNKQGLQGPQKVKSLNSIKIWNSNRFGAIHSCNHQKQLPCQILCGKIVKKVQIDPKKERYGQKNGASKKPKISQWKSLVYS